MSTIDVGGVKRKKTSYSAPALEKGLLILEAIAAEKRPLGPSLIAERIGHTNNEIVRLLYVLNQMGFIEKDEETGGYGLTSRLFTIANARPATRSLLEVALPLMRLLAERTNQSCHLSVGVDSRIVVVGRVEADRGMSLSVRVGYSRSMIGSASGSILCGFADPEESSRIVGLLKKGTVASEIEEFLKDAAAAKARGYEARPNNLVKGITDYAVPISRANNVTAALALAFVPLIDAGSSEEEVVREMTRTAKQIGDRLSPNEDY